MRKSIYLVIAALVSMFAVSCDKKTEPAGNVEKIEFSAKSISINIGEVKELELVFTPTNAANKGEVVYTTSNEKILTINKAGVMVGIAKGEALVTASIGDIKATVSVSVNVGVSSVVTDLSKDHKLYVTLASDDDKIDHAVINILPLDMEIDRHGQETGDGITYQLYVFSASQPDSIITDGTYELRTFNPDNITAGTAFAGQMLEFPTGAKPMGCMMGDYVRGELYSYDFMTEGDVVIKNHGEGCRVEFTVRYEDADTFATYVIDVDSTLTYNLRHDDYEAEHDPWALESEEITHQDITYGEAFGMITPAYEGIVYYEIWLSDENAEVDNRAYIGFYIDENAEDFYGKYNIELTFRSMTVAQSSGVDQGNYATPSYSGVFLEETQGLVNGKFWDNGTVTYTEEGLTFEIESHFGSTINGTYVGDVNFQTQGIAPKRMPVLARPVVYRMF